MITTKTILMTTALAAALAINAGCKGTTGPGEVDSVFNPKQHHAIHDFADTQAVAGAQSDPTLFRAHFTDGKINALGRDKLQLIFSKSDRATNPSHLFVDLPKADPLTAERHQAVLAYLKEELHDDQYNALRVVLGPNPEASTPTAPNLQRLIKTETGLGGAPDPAMSAMPSAAPAAK